MGRKQSSLKYTSQIRPLKRGFGFMINSIYFKALDQKMHFYFDGLKPVAVWKEETPQGVVFRRAGL